MAIKYGKKKHRQSNIIYAIITALLLGVTFLTMVSYFYDKAEDEAYEYLHVQTKQIKDDLTLQLLSDRENLDTMANFAAKLYADGEDYNLMFDSFKPIGLIENIGILKPDNTFVTKVGSVDLDGKISFEDEKERGAYISGRIKDLTRENYDIIRSVVPIKSNGNVVGILYGVIKVDVIGERYRQMANEIDAQLFVYDKKTGDLVIDTVHEEPENIALLKERKYNDGYSYEQMMNTDKGYTSFVSAYTGENMYMHYSTIEELGWVIALGRYESQVFEATNIMTHILFTAFFVMVVVMALYVLFIMTNERNRSRVMMCASDVRKLLLGINQHQSNIMEALKRISALSKARSVMFIDTDGRDYGYIAPKFEPSKLKDKDREYLMSSVIKYSLELRNINNAVVNVMCIKPGSHLEKTNPEFYAFLKKHSIREVSFATIIDENNHISILGSVNPKRSKLTRTLLEDVVVCFSIALYNKKYLNQTVLTATTDSLTGALNRVAYKKDLQMLDANSVSDFSCLYIDVNGLHLLNNKHGHAAGDEMLLYVANTLKKVFYGHKVYRMGGDEFLVFAADTEQDVIKKNIDVFLEQLKCRDYHVSVGMSFRKQSTNVEEMVKEAEKRMYEVKAQYYQNKESKNVSEDEEGRYLQIKTGISEIDTMLSVMKEHYNGIYRVSLNNDRAHRILMPAYLGYNEDEDDFSKLLTKYVDEIVDPDFHRNIMSSLNYDAIRMQLTKGNIPRITYKKTDGETVILSVYKLNATDDIDNTLWVFSKE